MSVWIAIPSYTGRPCKETQRSLRAGREVLAAHGIASYTETLSGMCYLDHARNIMVARFMASDSTDFIFVDDDVGFDRDALLRLCSAPYPLVAGVYPKKVTPPQWPVSIDAGMKATRDGFAECSVVPTGFMRIHRSVFEALKDRVSVYDNEQHGELRAYFKTDIHSRKYWGEDVEFCRLVREVGIKLHAFLDMNFRHVDKDGKVYSGNWGRFLFEQIREAA